MRPCINEVDRLIERIHGYDRQYRTKDFFFQQGVAVRNILHNGRFKPPPRRINATLKNDLTICTGKK